MTTESKIEILKTRIRAAEEAWRWCLANGRPAGAASRDMHAALANSRIPSPLPMRASSKETTPHEGGRSS